MFFFFWWFQFTRYLSSLYYCKYSRAQFYFNILVIVVQKECFNDCNKKNHTFRISLAGHHCSSMEILISRATYEDSNFLVDLELQFCRCIFNIPFSNMNSILHASLFKAVSTFLRNDQLSWKAYKELIPTVCTRWYDLNLSVHVCWWWLWMIWCH